MYRWLILSVSAEVLAHWGYLSTQPPVGWIDWAQAAEVSLHQLLPQLVTLLLLLKIARLQSLLRSQGFDIQISRCKM